MMSGGVNLVMTVIGFAVSTMFIVFVCTRLICARIQLYASRRAFARANRSDLSILERGLHGIEPVIVANFPTKKYSEAYFPSAETAQCTVCLGDYHKEDILRILPPCGHFFHASCIDIWLHQHSTCPVCRVSLRDLPEKKCFMHPMFSSAIRFQYGMQSNGVNSGNCSLDGQTLSSVTNDNQRMEPFQEESCQHEGVEAAVGDSNSILINDYQKDSGNKKHFCLRDNVKMIIQRREREQFVKLKEFLTRKMRESQKALSNRAVDKSGLSLPARANICYHSSCHLNLYVCNISSSSSTIQTVIVQSKSHKKAGFR